MKKSRLPAQAVRLCTGKYGTLLLTLLNVGLACLAVTLSNRWLCIDPARGSGDFMTFYLLDYRVGFVSRALIGSILYLFTEHPTVRMVSNVLHVCIALSVLLFSFFQAQLAKKTLLRHEHATLLLSYLFFLNSIFWCNAFDFFGLLDIFMTLLVQLFLLCAERSQTCGAVLAPVVCFAGMLIHTAFFFSCFPVVAAILWYELLQRGKPNALRVTSFGVTCLLSLGLFILFVFFTQEMVRVNLDEMLTMLHEKYDGPIDEEYHTVYLFQVSEEHTTITRQNYLDFLFHYSQTDLTSSKVRLLLLDIAPLTVVYLGGCVFHARKTGNRILAYLGFIAPLVTLFPAMDFSTDKERFVSLFLIAQYMLMHYVVMRSDDYFLPCVASPPLKTLSRYETQRRQDRLRRALQWGAAAGLVFTLVGYRVF